MAADTRHKPATSDFPLHAFEICRSTDFEEVRALVRAEFDLDVVPTARGDTATDAVISCLNLPGLSLTYVHYGPPVEVRVRQPGRNYNVVLPLAGRVERDYADETQVCVPTRTSLRSPCRFTRTRFSAGARRVNLAIGRDAMVRRLSTLMGEGAYDDLVFERRLDLAHGFGASLRSYLFWAMGEFDRGAKTSLPSRACRAVPCAGTSVTRSGFRRWRICARCASSGRAGISSMRRRAIPSPTWPGVGASAIWDDSPSTIDGCSARRPRRRRAGADGRESRPSV